MCALLRKESDDAPRGRVKRSAWHVHGVRYANSAAKFWMSLVDEALDLFPDCTQIELSATLGKPFDREQLHPANLLAHELERLAEADLAEAMRETLAEMELFGPPGPIAVRLLAQERELLSQPLPLECIDAEIMPFMTVWLLEWAGIAEARWNDASLMGRFNATDAARVLFYGIELEVSRRHLSEGLYALTLALWPTLTVAV